MKKFLTRKALSLSAAAVVVFTLIFAHAGVISAESGGSVGTITIVHTNDIHGYYTEVSKSGVLGFAKLKGLIDSVGADLVLDAGDTFHGQAFATVEQGESIAELMAAVGYDATTPGNHDFSYGVSKLKELESAYNIPILASNIKENGQDYLNTPYIVEDIDVSGVSVRVGILGVVDDDFYKSTASENVAGVEFTEEAAEATAVAKTLRDSENCDIVIALTHQKDCQSFVSNISGIDVVIAGHEHILIDETYTDAAGESVKVVEAGYYFYNIGVLELEINADKEIVSETETVYSADNMSEIAADENINAKISEIETREQSVLSTVVGQSEAEYVYSWEEIRVGEQEIGHIVTAAYLERTGADVAIENAGGIRAGIPEGEVTYKDIISISPYGNVLVTKTVTGQGLIDILETSIEIGIQCDAVYTLQKKAVENGEDPYQYSWPSSSGSYLQFGGISVVYDPEASAGERVISVKVGDEDIDLQKTYTVATNNYVAESERYPALSGAEIDTEYGTCEETLIKFVKNGDMAAAAAKTVFTVYNEEETTAAPETQETSDQETSQTEEASSQETSQTEETSDQESDTKETAQSTGTTTPSSQGGDGENKTTASPQTGDESNVMLFIIIAGICAAAGGFAVSKRKSA